MKTSYGTKAVGLSLVDGIITPVAFNPEYPFEFDRKGNSVGMNTEVLERYTEETKGAWFSNA